MNALEKYINREFDKGWKDFVGEIREKNKISNQRLIKVVYAVLGQSVADDLISLSLTIDPGAYLFLVSKPKGIELKDDRWVSFPTIWADYQSGQYAGQCLYVKLRDNKFIKIYY